MEQVDRLRSMLLRLDEGGTSRQNAITTEANVQPPAIVQPAPIVTEQPRQDPLGSKLRAWINMPAQIDEAVKRKFSAHKVILGRAAAKADWKDDELKNLQCYKLSYLEDEEIIEVGKSFMYSMHIEMKKSAMAEMFILAYNLRDNAGDRIIGDINLDLIDLDKTLPHDEITGNIKEISTKAAPTITIPDDTAKNREKIAKAFSYIAASYLRLFTKSAENYVKIENHLTTRFERFYSFALPFSGFHPELTAVKLFKNQLELLDRCKNTLYIFLYAASSNPAGKNIKDFLYGIHISYTGMHALTLFLRAMESLGKTNVELASALWTPKIDREIKSIMKVIDTYIKYGGDPAYEKGMWKYARLFDPTFLNDLQTKNCVYFTLVLAYLVRDKGTTAHRDVFNIAQLKNASDRTHRLAKAHALIALNESTGQRSVYWPNAGLETILKLNSSVVNHLLYQVIYYDVQGHGM